MQSFYPVQKVCAVALVVLGAGCVSLSEAGAKVRVGKMPPHSNCRELGIVYGTGGGAGATSSEFKMRRAQNGLRNETAAMGGNFVVMDTSGADGGGITLSGRAFKCGKAPPQSSTVSAPASQPSAEDRLRKLKGLLDKGLITQDEHDKRRAEILQSI